MAKTSRFWGSRFGVRISNSDRLDCLSGKAPDFFNKKPVGGFVCSTQRARPNRPLQFQKRTQLLIGTHNEAFSVAAMLVCNPDCSFACNTDCVGSCRNPDAASLQNKAHPSSSD